MCKINSAKSLLYCPPLQCYLYLILLEKKQYQTILKMCRSSFCTEKCIVDSRNLPIKTLIPELIIGMSLILEWSKLVSIGPQ